MELQSTLYNSVFSCKVYNFSVSVHCELALKTPTDTVDSYLLNIPKPKQNLKRQIHNVAQSSKINK